MNNTVILKKGYVRLTTSEYKRFNKGDTIWGIDSTPTEIKRWDIKNEEEAKKELDKYVCSYKEGNVWDIEEYALEYCECSGNGEFIQGSDYTLANEK